MKMVRYGMPGAEKPGVVDKNGILRDAAALAGDWRDWRVECLGDDFLSQIRDTDFTTLPPAPADTRLGPPVAGSRKIVGIGLNYRAHAAEAGMSPPDDLLIFHKPVSALCGPNDDIILPRGGDKTDWEIELAVVIGRGGKYIAEKDALDYVAGYCVGNDVSERCFQLERGHQWAKGKGADTFAPLGPWLVTRDEVPDPQNLNMTLELNDEVRQRGNTGDMVFTVAQIISRLSGYMSLQAGDILMTGTPPGVGLAANPPRFLKPGDALKLRIEGLGEQQSEVVAAR